jgi:hypothetical protein
MEVNGRPNLPGALSVRCGIDLPLMTYHHLVAGRSDGRRGTAQGSLDQRRHRPQVCRRSVGAGGALPSEGPQPCSRGGLRGRHRGLRPVSDQDAPCGSGPTRSARPLRVLVVAASAKAAKYLWSRPDLADIADNHIDGSSDLGE